MFPPGSKAEQSLLALPERIVLTTLSPELQALPWEYLYDGKTFLVTEYPFARALPADQRQPFAGALSNLHVLAIPSDPLSEDIVRLSIDSEWLRLEEIISELQTAVTLERVRPPTALRLGELAAGQQQLIVHFMGHGGKTADGAILWFEQDNGAPLAVPAREFVKQVRKSAFLVTLNACVSATPGETEFSNLAEALVRVSRQQKWDSDEERERDTFPKMTV